MQSMRGLIRPSYREVSPSRGEGYIGTSKMLVYLVFRAILSDFPKAQLLLRHDGL